MVVSMMLSVVTLKEKNILRMKAYFSVEQVDGNLDYLITSMLVLESSSCSEKVNQVQMYELPTILVLLKRSSSGSRPFNDNKWK